MLGNRAQTETRQAEPGQRDVLEDLESTHCIIAVSTGKIYGVRRTDASSREQRAGDVVRFILFIRRKSLSPYVPFSRENILLCRFLTSRLQPVQFPDRESLDLRARLSISVDHAGIGNRATPSRDYA